MRSLLVLCLCIMLHYYRSNVYVQKQCYIFNVITFKSEAHYVAYSFIVLTAILDFSQQYSQQWIRQSLICIILHNVSLTGSSFVLQYYHITLLQTQKLHQFVNLLGNISEKYLTRLHFEFVAQLYTFIKILNHFWYLIPFFHPPHFLLFIFLPYPSFLTILLILLSI